MIIVNREELAWAAGFFDGEGNTRYSNKPSARKYDRSNISLQVQQVDPEVLYRFQQAVFGLGKIYGPYPRTDYKRGIERQPQWQFSCQRRNDVQAIVAALWPFLSRIKRDQAASALSAAQANWRRKRQTSQHQGVDLHKASGKWRARVRVSGTVTYLGLWPTEAEALDAIRQMEERLS